MNQLNCLPQDAIFWGHDILPTAVASLDQHGIRRPLTFTVEPLRDFHAQHLQAHVKGGLGVFTDLPPHAPDVGVRRALEACLHAGADSIIALGGGSVIDAAKAVSHLHHQETGRHLAIAALPTTFSGSEFSHYFGITETTGPQTFKRSYAVRETVPKVVALDPKLLLNTPRELLLSSAIKGIDHAVEGMRQVTIDHPHAILAAAGVERFLAVLEKWPQQLDTQRALRERHVTTDDLLQLQLAAWQSYFFPASVIYGLSHRIGHILGGTFGLPHSITSCITLAPVLRACAESYGDKLQIFCRGRATSNAAALLADRISNAVEHLGLPHRLRSVDFDRAQLPRVAALLQQNYANEVGDLGDGNGATLNGFLESLW
ncbi:iron-containing alcohol dehydrogenase [Cupriavidus necator]|uniref:iron-containing alcohol dehydrogenase n=1 Tax=Cupriavidus necator TaxID=106590 RepID=UPI0005B48E57|nr:iron-containing alcohol dehydrogenase [Cupriavidus necator]